MSWEREDGLLAASVGLVQLVSLRSLDKYVFHDRLLTVLAAAALGTTMFLLPRNYERVLSVLPERAGRIAVSPAAFRALALVLAGGSLVVYPMADELKAIGRGSDGDDAIILAATNLLTHLDPYRSSTLFGQSDQPRAGVGAARIALGDHWPLGAVLPVGLGRPVPGCPKGPGGQCDPGVWRHGSPVRSRDLGDDGHRG